jgi:hypothetical protein
LKLTLLMTKLRVLVPCFSYFTDNSIEFKYLKCLKTLIEKIEGRHKGKWYQSTPRSLRIWFPAPNLSTWCNWYSFLKTLQLNQHAWFGRSRWTLQILEQEGPGGVLKKTNHCLHIVYILFRLKKALEDSNGNWEL